MQLITAFSIRDKEVVAFVGGGGKTTTMFRLAGELVAQGKRVVTTTTTRIFAAQIQHAPRHVRVEDEKTGLRDIRREIARYPHVLAVGAVNQEGKAPGIAPELVDELIGLEGVDAVLIEADGSRMRPLKAPAEHEPVVPSSTTLLVPVAGIDVVGKPLGNEHVHRAEWVGRIAGIAADTPVQARHVAQVLRDTQGGLKNRPAGARVIPFLNKVETTEQLASARVIADMLLESEAIEAVAIGAAQTSASPVRELDRRVAAVILAAGGSMRMGGSVKQLLAWGDTTLVENAARVVEGSRASEIVAVTGNHAQAVVRELRGHAHIRLVNNPDWATGRASSVRAGVEALGELAAGAIFVNADQPFLTADVIDAVLERFFETRAPIVTSTYQGKTGSPVLFAREVFAELGALHGEQGGRDLLEKYREAAERVEIADARAALDVDTREEYERARAMSDER